MPVKQLPSLVNPIPAARAAAATYSWPLRITCAANGGCPDILMVTCPQAGSMTWNDVVVDERPLLRQVGDGAAGRRG